MIERTPDPTSHQPRDPFSVAATRQTDGSFRCYLSPFLFPDVSAALSYSIVAGDTANNPRWLGSGALIVLENPANGSSVVPPIVPADTYIRNPATGLYHLLTASLNEDGELTINLADEGIER